MVLGCSCQGYMGSTVGAKWQDSMYGENQRVHTPMVKENMYRCTVCMVERAAPSKKSKKELAEEADDKGKGKKK